MGSTGVRAPVWTVSGMGYWKRLIKIPGSTDCYYYINHMTCSIHVYIVYLYLLHFLLSYPTIISLYALHFLYFSHTLLIYTYTLHFMYYLFHVFFVDTLFWYNHKHYSVITFVYFMCTCSYLSSLYYRVTSTISSNSKYNVIKTWHV